ncbi:hypothetical protein Tco_1491864 [Tanacetum coccineum]
MNFVVVRSPSPYNEIIRRPRVRKLQAVPSTVHKMLKIPVEGGVITLKRSGLVPLECAVVSEPERILPADKLMVEERIKVAINPDYLEQTVMIGSTLTEEEHHLNMWKGCSPVRQKKRGQAADRNHAIQEEVGKLVEAGITREVHYHDWLSNPVMIKKHDDIDDQNRTPPDYSDWKRQKKHSKHGVCYTNRSSAQDSSRAGLILTNPEGMEFTYALRFRTYVEKETNMIRYLEKVKTLTNSFKAFSIKQFPRSENKKADALSKIASIRFAHLSKQVLVEELKEKSINATEVLAVVEKEGDT